MLDNRLEGDDLNQLLEEAAQQRAERLLQENPTLAKREQARSAFSEWVTKHLKKGMFE